MNAHAFLTLAFLVGAFAADTDVYNSFIDSFLNNTRKAIIENGKNLISVPNVNYTFERKISFLIVKGGLICKNGYIKSLSNFKRSSNTIVTKENNITIFRIGLLFDDLVFGYDRCIVRSNIIPGVSGVQAIVKSAAVNVEISMDEQSERCNIIVDDIYLTDLNGVKIQTGRRVVNRLMDKVINWVAKEFRIDALNLINRNVKEQLSTQKTWLCDQISQANKRQ